MYVDDILKIKDLVLNVPEFLKFNNIKMQYSERFVEMLNSKFIGFLTRNKTKLVCRCIDPSCELRYLNIQTNNGIYEKDFYSIDLMENFTLEKENDIVFTEGIIDAINITNNPMFKKLIDKTASIVACLGNDYRNSIFSTFHHLKIIDGNVHIFSDNEKDLNLKETLLKKYKNLTYIPNIKKLYLYWNTEEKDYSYTPDKLKIKFKQLK